MGNHIYLSRPKYICIGQRKPFYNLHLSYAHAMNALDGDETREESILWSMIERELFRGIRERVFIPLKREVNADKSYTMLE